MEADKSKCLICEMPCSQKGLTFFKFPEEESRLSLWIKEVSPLLEILKIQENSLRENGRICARHFREKDFINSKKDSLVQNACPSLSVSNFNINFHKNSRMNEEVSEMEDFLQNNQSDDESEKDTFQCGRCKVQFEMLPEFMDHKRYNCQPGITRSSKGSLQMLTPLNPDNLLDHILVNSANNHLSEVPVQEYQTPEQMVKIISGEGPTDRTVSLVLNDKLVVGAASDLPVLPVQVLLSPSMPQSYNEVVRVAEASPLELPLASQLIVAPPAPVDGPLLLSNSDEAQLGSLIITADGGGCASGVVYICPVPGGNGAVVAPGAGASQVVLAGEVQGGAGASQVVFAGEVQGGGVSYCGVSGGAVGAVGETWVAKGGEGEEGEGEGEEEGEERGRSKQGQERGRRLPCSYCGKSFEKPFNLFQHERIHTGERPFQCIICGRAFTQKSNVRKHMKRHKVWPKGKQTMRPRVGGGGGGQVGEMDYSCQYCSSSFKSYGEHKKHLAVHSNIKVYRCIQNDCEQTFEDLDEFLSHSKMHSSAEFRCHICFKVFTSLEDLGAHQYDHDTRSKKRERGAATNLKCHVCHARFKATESLKNHLAVENHHHECFHCKSVFNSERFLRRHLFIHMDPAQAKFKCQICDKAFRTQQNLRKHGLTHLEEKPFSCEHCDKKFICKYRLKRHIALHLSRYIECPFKNHLGCDKKFYRKDKLRDHVSTHSHCRLRSCRICSKMYWTLSKFHHHMKTDHRGRGKAKEVLKCPTCLQTFRKQKQLAQHHCTVEEKKGKSRQEEGRGAVSNIEILMVPFESAVTGLT